MSRGIRGTSFRRSGFRLDKIGLFAYAHNVIMDAVEDIKSRLDIVDLLSEYLTVKPAGAGAFKALCPFHQEKTPSFYISRTRQTWHCFGCDTGGDHFTFVQRMEGMEFREALEHLAQKAGVVLPAFDHEASSRRKRLHEVHDMAVRFFAAQLETSPQAEAARAYVNKRGLDHLTMDLFKLGYAPAGWTTLTDALIAKGVTADELVRAGLAIKREGKEGVYDRFRDRLMFPIADVHGNIIGFTGRILTDSKTEAKYVNTPETALYKKSAVLYGLDKAKGEIRRLQQAVIVEGNMDVISSHQFGIANVVAASGTALTTEQLMLIKRFTTRLAIAFDQDAAGNAATLRGLDVARQQDFTISIITLPPEAGKDPDEAVRKDPALWTRAISEAIGIMEWVYRNAFRGHDLSKAEEKKLIARAVLPEIKRVADPIERDHWMKKLAFDLGVSEQALREAMGEASSLTHRTQMARPTSSEKLTVSHPSVSNDMQAERRFLALMIYRPELYRWAATEGRGLESAFDQEVHRALYERLMLGYDPAIYLDKPLRTSDVAVIHPPDHLNPEERALFESLAFLAEREYQDMGSDALSAELKTSAAKLRSLYKARERKRLEQDMRDAERVGDQTKIADLAARFASLRD